MSSSSRPPIAPRQGDVWLVDLGNPIGHEAGLRRPGFVISADEFNDFGLVTVLPITSADKPYPTRVRVPAGRSGLRHDSFIQVEHIRTVSAQRLIRHLGQAHPQLPPVQHVLKLLLRF